MEKYYSKGNKVTRILGINEENKSYIYYEKANKPELTEKLKQANFKKILRKEIITKAITCYARDYEDFTTWKLDAIDFLKLVIKKDIEKEETQLKEKQTQLKKGENKMTKKQFKELKEAAEYLGNAAIMLEGTIGDKEIDLDQLEIDQNLVRERAERVYWAIESIKQNN